MVRRDITPTIAQIITSQETGEELIEQPGGSMMDDSSWSIGPFRVVFLPSLGRIACIDGMTSGLSLGS